MSKKIVIKRYGNRRLYNSETRSYVKLQDIAGFIREGSDIQVLDSRTGEDITKLVLTQIILEEEKNKKDLLPLNFLYDLIRHQQGWVQEFFQRHIVKALEGYLPLPPRGELLSQLRQSLDIRAASAGLLDRLLNRGEVPEKGDDSRRAGADPASARSLEEAADAPLAGPLLSDEAPEPLSGDPLEELLQRLETLESRLGHIEASLPQTSSAP